MCSSFAKGVDRRRFLKLAGATGALAIPSVLGYNLRRDVQGEPLPDVSPYAPVDILESWPTQPELASPILVLVDGNSDNPFGRYLAEILRAEGLNCFQMAEMEDLGNAPLNWYDLILRLPSIGALCPCSRPLVKGQSQLGSFLLYMNRIFSL